MLSLKKKLSIIDSFDKRTVLRRYLREVSFNHYIEDYVLESRLCSILLLLALYAKPAQLPWLSKLPPSRDHHLGLESKSKWTEWFALKNPKPKTKKSAKTTYLITCLSKAKKNKPPTILFPTSYLNPTNRDPLCRGRCRPSRTEQRRCRPTPASVGNGSGAGRSSGESRPANRSSQVPRDRRDPLSSFEWFWLWAASGTQKKTPRSGNWQKERFEFSLQFLPQPSVEMKTISITSWIAFSLTQWPKAKS